MMLTLNQISWLKDKGYIKAPVATRKSFDYPNGIETLNGLRGSFYQFNSKGNTPKIDDGMYTLYLHKEWYPEYTHIYDLTNQVLYTKVNQ